MKKPIAACLLFFLFVLVACSNVSQPAPTAIPTPAFTAIPALTATRIPTNTLVSPSETSDLIAGLIPEGQPGSEWNGIPIMPEAIAGDGDVESYVFTVRKTPQQVQEYYQRELGKLGWQPLSTGNGDSSLMLMFMDSSSTTLTVSIIAKGDEVLVLLVK